MLRNAHAEWRHARRLSYALHCAILTTPSLYIVGSIAFGRRGTCYTRYRCHVPTI